MLSVLLFSHPRQKYLSFVLANSAPCMCFPLRLSPLRGPLLGHHRLAFLREFHKSDCFSQKHLDDTPLSSFPLPFVCPFLCLVIFYFIYLFFFHSFTEGLLQYKPWGKGLGEIAADIITKAVKATDDVAMQAQLGLKAFLKAVLESIGHELRRKHFQSVLEALKEARFLQTVQDSEKLEEGKVLSIAREQEKPKGNRVDLEHVVGECLKQLQAQANVAEKNERPGNADRGRFRC